MSYRKPQLVTLGSALSAIQGQLKDCPTPVDSGNMKKTTPNAYEADE